MNHDNRIREARARRPRAALPASLATLDARCSRCWAACATSSRRRSRATARAPQTPQPPGRAPPTTPPPGHTARDTRRRRSTRGTPTTTAADDRRRSVPADALSAPAQPANFCVGCHGATQIPTFAVADVMTAYNVITTQQKVNLVEPELSRVYLRPAVDRHNCGGNAACDASRRRLPRRDPAVGAATVRRRRRRRRPQALKSAVTSFSRGAGSGNGRADANVGRDLQRSTKARAPRRLDARQADHAATSPACEWVQGGLKNVSGKAQANATDSRKLFDAISPARSVQRRGLDHCRTTSRRSGPARIVSYSNEHEHAQLHAGQGAADYRGRVRTR